MSMLNVDELNLEAGMNTTASSDISNLVAARRLMEMEKGAKARRSGKVVEEKSAFN